MWQFFILQKPSFLISKNCQNSKLHFVSMIQKGVDSTMTEMESGKNRNLKNVKQIGTPREENKIYICDFNNSSITCCCWRNFMGS